jgi:hypothetical protein
MNRIDSILHDYAYKSIDDQILLDFYAVLMSEKVTC